MPASGLFSSASLSGASLTSSSGGLTVGEATGFFLFLRAEILILTEITFFLRTRTVRLLKNFSDKAIEK